MKRRSAVRIPPRRRAAVSRRVRELVRKGYSPQYAAQLAYHPGRDPKKLTAAERARIPSRRFALPERRSLPLTDPAHVRNAAARLEQMRRRGTVTSAEYRRAHQRILKAEAHFGIQPSRDPARPTRRQRQMIAAKIREMKHEGYPTLVAVAAAHRIAGVPRPKQPVKHLTPAEHRQLLRARRRRR